MRSTTDEEYHRVVLHVNPILAVPKYDKYECFCLILIIFLSCWVDFCQSSRQHVKRYLPTSRHWARTLRHQEDSGPSRFAKILLCICPRLILLIKTSLFYCIMISHQYCFRYVYLALHPFLGLFYSITCHQDAYPEVATTH